jgi:TPR repeat protein
MYLNEKKPEESLVWLCRSADSGNQDARLILAKIYEHAGDNWIKEGILERDDKLAYVWYALSGKDQEALQFFADLYLTSE